MNDEELNDTAEGTRVKSDVNAVNRQLLLPSLLHQNAADHLQTRSGPIRAWQWNPTNMMLISVVIYSDLLDEVSWC